MDERGFGGGMYFFNVVFLGKIFWYCCGSSEWGGVKYDVIMVFVMCFCCKKKGYKIWYKFRDFEF